VPRENFLCVTIRIFFVVGEQGKLRPILREYLKLPAMLRRATMTMRPDAAVNGFRGEIVHDKSIDSRRNGIFRERIR
jgi:hypothetical protein